MYRIQCQEIWGGIRNQEQDVCSAGVVASLYSAACDGGKGGDIYYLSVCGADMLTRIAVADVVGHGQAVSQVSQYVYDALKAHMNDTSGGELLAAVNRQAAERGFDAMTTAAVAAFYTSDHNLYFAYAGHHPILVKRKQQRHWGDALLSEPDDAPEAAPANLPLAVMANCTFTQQQMPLTAGDRVFLYTDGVVEAPDRDGNEFGAARLKALLDDYATAPLQQLRTAVLDELRDHTGNNLTHDDVTLLAVEVR